MTKTPEVTVSSDLGGFFADPARVQSLYERAGYTCDIELLLMPFQQRYLVAASHAQPIPFAIGGVHGRLGASEKYEDHEKGLVDWLIIKIADCLLPQTICRIFPWSTFPMALQLEIAAQSLEKDLYLNVHNSEVKTQFTTYTDCAKNYNDYTHLAIENGPDKDDVAETVDQVHRLHDLGGERVTGTFDLVHAVIGLIDGAVPDFPRVAKVWATVLTSIDPVFDRIHLPIGLRADDSLPILAMLEERTMLRDLGQMVQERGIRVTIENQHDLLMGVANEAAEVERLKEVHEGLLESQVLKNYK